MWISHFSSCQIIFYTTQNKKCFNPIITLKCVIKHDFHISVLNQMFDTHYLDITIATKSDHDIYMTCTRMKDACWRSISWNVFLPENKDYKLISGGIYMLLLKMPSFFVLHYSFNITVGNFAITPQNMEVVKMAIFICIILQIS